MTVSIQRTQNSSQLRLKAKKCGHLFARRKAEMQIFVLCRVKLFWNCCSSTVDVWFRSTEVNVFYVKNHTLFNPCSQSAERSKGETFLGFDETCIPCAVEEACSGYEKPGSLCDRRGLNFKQASPLIKPTDVFCCNREALWWCACLKVCIKQSTLVIKVNTRSACVHPPSF